MGTKRKRDACITLHSKGVAHLTPKMILKNRHRFTPFESPAWSLLVQPESSRNRETRQFFSETVALSLLVKHKNPQSDLKFRYQKIYELSLTVTLVLLITMFQLARRFYLTAEVTRKYNIQIEVTDVPMTEQFLRLPQPVTPIIPIPTEEEFNP